MINYADLKWLGANEAQLIDKSRKILLQSLSGSIKHRFSQNKLHTGKLSRGCLICGQGYWSCMYINSLCTANCFYCPQNRKIKKERFPRIENKIVFANPEDYAAYLKKFGFKGASFSGGEPLLVFEKLVTYIKEVNKKLGDDFYIWVYTNGDLVTKDKLKALKEAGLDEIRFDISARDYKLHGVELAVPIIDTVTVEIPCIPEDYEILKKCLIQMQNIGVKHLNIHQLLTTKYNYKNFTNRDYTFLHHPLIPILESEMTALKLMRHALDNRIKLPINYCSCAYKVRLQDKGRRQRWAPFIKKDFEDFTELGYIRRLSIKGPPAKIKKITNIFRVNKHGGGNFKVNKSKTVILFSSFFLRHINLDAFDLTVKYFKPEIDISNNQGKNIKEIKLSSRKSIFIIKKPVFQWKELSSTAKRNFQKLFSEGINQKKNLASFFKSYNLDKKVDIYKLKQEIGNLVSVEELERLKRGLPEIYQGL